MNEWMSTSMLTCWEGKTGLLSASRVPHKKNYIVESMPDAKEIQMGTMAESLELQFRLYLYLNLNF